MGRRVTLCLLIACAAGCTEVDVDAVDWTCDSDEACGDASVCLARPGEDLGVCIAIPPDGIVVVDGGDAPRGCSPFWQAAGGDVGDCSAESPFQVVFVPRFGIDQTEVPTFAYDACASCPAREVDIDPACNRGSDPDALFRPANCVTWDGAAAFCAQAGGRLCSEAEWEKAATGPCTISMGCVDPTNRFPMGAALPGCGQVALAVVGGETCEVSGTVTPLELPADLSPYGVLSMAGNVAEWVADCWAPGYDVQPTDGRAYQPAEPCALRVHRGGAFDGPEQDAQVFRRRSAPPQLASPSLGFRCCHDLPPLSE